MPRTPLLVALTLPLFCYIASAIEAAKAPVVPAELPPQIQTLQPGVKLTLLAENPDLVTPVGVDVDAQGNIYVVSNHTHFRPQGYAGPEHDEILVFDKNGKNRRVFYNKTNSTMHLKLGPDGWVYLSERSRILRIKDTNGDGVADIEEPVATLDTVSTYPHNGLSGMAWHPDGGLVFSLGENFGKDWTLTSRDGVKLTGRGEGGIFRCTADGENLRLIAHGFWNPFGLFVRNDGEIFAADNDPGSRPPCRLLTIIEGSDYGYQWVYGSAPVHPFVAWNGELRGTLPMIFPSGEAPCAVVPLGGGLVVQSWSDHCVNYFPLTRKGAGYTSHRIELLRGSEYFRPTGIARGADGAFYICDWVFSSYELHGRGRLWKMEIDPATATWMQKEADPINGDAQLAKDLRDGRTKLSPQQLFAHARGGDPYLSDAALAALARESAVWTPETLRALPVEDRVWALVALRRVNIAEEKWVRALLNDPNPEIRFECLRWIADGVLTSFAADVEKMLSKPDLDYRLFEAALAAANTLRGNPGAGVTDVAVLSERLTNPAVPARLRGFALRLIPPTHPSIRVPLLRELLLTNDPTLSLEVVRTLVGRSTDDARAMLAEIASDEARESSLRAEAIVGLSASAAAEHHSLLVKLAAHETKSIRDEALRALRSSPIDEAEKKSIGETAMKHSESAALVTALLDPASINAGRPSYEDTDAWLKRLAALPGKADVDAGRRIFSHPRMALCATCHRHSGRGNVVGPDLSLIARQSDLKGTLQSILEPNREVAPQYFPTLLKLADGGEFVGIMLRSSSVEVYRDITGKERPFKKADILDRTELKTSLMPPGLVATLTDEELRDLLAFVRSDELK